MKHILIIFLFMSSLLYGADNTINVVKNVATLPTIAIEDASTDFSTALQDRFFKAIKSDLNVLSIFNVDSSHYKVTFSNDTVLPEEKNNNYILRYRLVSGESKTLTVDVKLFKKSQLVMQKSYKINNSKLYIFISHAIAYDVNKYMGAAPVEWMKKKVIFSRLLSSGQSEIVISDYTMSYQYVIVKGGLNIFPIWANQDQTSFYFTSLNGAKPMLEKVNISTGKVTKILSSDGMIACSDVSQDGNRILVTMAPHGQPDIYLYDTSSKKLTRLTHFSGIDVDGQFFGNDSIVFVSDRLGYPTVFSKTIGSNAVSQLVFEGHHNTSCAVSGHYIVYESRETNNAFSVNTYNLHLMSTQTDYIRRLTAVGVNILPRFSQDGNTILFIKKYKGQSAVGVIRLNYNKDYLFPLKHENIQGLDW